MKIQKKDLNFLETFVQISDTKNVLGDKLLIRVRGNEAIFCQFSFSATLMKVVAVTSTKDFEGVYPVRDFWSLIKAMPDRDLEIQENSITYDKGSKYTFEALKINFPDFENTFKKVVLKEQAPDSSISLKNFDLLNRASSFIGKDGFEVINLNKGHFVASDQVVISIVACPDNNLNRKDIFFPKAITDYWIKTFSGNKDAQLGINFFKNGIWFFEINGLFFVISEQKYDLPDIFEPNLSKLLDHPQSIKINRGNLLEILERMAVMAADSPNNRVWIFFNYGVSGGILRVETKDHNESFEELICEDNPNLNGIQFSINCSNFIRILNSFKVEEVHLYVSPTGKTSIITDQKSQDGDFTLKYVHAYSHSA